MLPIALIHSITHSFLHWAKTCWLNLENTVLSERSQSQKSTYYPSLMKGSFMETESSSVVLGLRRWGQRGESSRALVSFCRDGNVLKLVVAPSAQLCKYTKNHAKLYTRVHRRECELHPNRHRYSGVNTRKTNTVLRHVASGGGGSGETKNPTHHFARGRRRAKGRCGLECCLPGEAAWTSRA